MGIKDLWEKIISIFYPYELIWVKIGSWNVTNQGLNRTEHCRFEIVHNKRLKRFKLIAYGYMPMYNDIYYTSVEVLNFLNNRVNGSKINYKDLNSVLIKKLDKERCNYFLKICEENEDFEKAKLIKTRLNYLG